MNNDTLVNIARNRSFVFANCYRLIHEKRALPGVFASELKNAEYHELVKTANRLRQRMEEEKATKRKQAFQAARMTFWTTVSKRKDVKRMRKLIKINAWWSSFRASHLNSTNVHELLENEEKRKKYIRIIGSYADDRIQNMIKEHQPQKVKKSLKDELPLYACSGELEANRINAVKLHRIDKKRKGEVYSSGCYIWKFNDKLDFGRDGGGQCETRFLIKPEITRIVCSVVTNIGKLNRNGGHIHINCRGDEAIGERVYNALRYHLTWMRWLVPAVRRRHIWCAMTGVRDTFESAKTVKQAAISANTWSRTGTVEIRLWGTSNKPEDWQGRAAVMQAIAKWSETHQSMQADGTPHQITRDTQVQAWEQFYQWASVNAPDALKYALQVIRKKSRLVRDNLDKEQCTSLYNAFLASNIVVRGFRRRNRAAVNN